MWNASPERSAELTGVFMPLCCLEMLFGSARGPVYREGAYELQLMDKRRHWQGVTGPSSHEACKRRQVETARLTGETILITNIPKISYEQ